MTNKQRAFVIHYLACFNATKAAIAAGYSPKTAYSIGHENLNKPKIRAEIEKGLEDLAERVMVSTEGVLQGLWREAEGRGPNTTPSARVRALIALGKHLGLWSPHFRSQLEDEGPVILDLLG